MAEQAVRQADWDDWRWQWRNRLQSLEDIGSRLGWEDDQLMLRQAAAEKYPPLTTPYYLSLADPDNPEDPILRQVLPESAEVERRWAARPDPLGEEDSSPVAGLVHRYPDRALLILTARCAVHCRHCLRKRNWQAVVEWDERKTARVLRYLRQNRRIREVILSGGDPLLLDEDFLFDLLARLREIESLSVIRIGSRLPVVMPQRFSEVFCRKFGCISGLWLATHFNHPRELTAAAADACRRLSRAGVSLVNQSVLLKGINDETAIMRELGLGLLRIQVKPYYLFHGDPVAGTRHFRTGIERGLSIMRELRGTVSGLAIPVFAIDLPEGGGKVPLTPAMQVEEEGERENLEPLFEGRCGGLYRYADDGPE